MKFLKKFVLTLVTLVLSFLAFRFWFKDDWLAGMMTFSIFGHELAHAVVAIFHGYKVNQMLFIPFLGALVKLEDNAMESMTDFERATMALAGPAFNFVAAFGGVYLALSGYPQDYAIALISSNILLGYTNLLPLGIFDGARFSSAIFDSLDETGDQVTALVIRVLATAGGIGLILMGKYTFTYLLISWGISTQSRKDDPYAYRSPQAMRESTAHKLLVLYVVLLLGGMLVSAFLPNFMKVFGIWPY